MAKGKRISEQPILDTLVGDELIPFAKNGANGAVEADTIKEYAQDGLDDKYADKSDTYTKSEVDGLVDGATSTAETTYAKKEDVPTKVSELENDSKYQTESEVDGKLTDKVDKEDGKGLSSNDYTDEDKAKLDRFELVLANDDEIEDGLHQIASSEDYRSKLKENGYVVYHDVKFKVKDCGVTSDSFPWIVTEGAIITANEEGELSDHTQKNIARSVYIWFDTILHYQPYGSIIPSKVSELTNDLKYTTETQVENSLAILYESLDSQLVDEYTHLDNKKVDKVTGKGLSTNDYTTDDKDKLGALPTNAELTTTLATKADKTSVDTELAKKVDKVSGKQLSTEDFTTLLKQKLEGLTNYDDSTLTSELNALKSRLDTLVGSGDVTAVIDTFQEIEAFLQGITNTQTLTGLLQEMKGEIVAMIPTDNAKVVDFNLSAGEIYKLSGLQGSYLLSSRGTNSEICSLIWFSTYGSGGYQRTTSRVIYSKGIEAYVENDVDIASVYVKNTHFGSLSCSLILLNNNAIPTSEIVNDLPTNVATITADINRLISAAGTSSQFLKADGSVDSTAYLPTSGGTLTGGLKVNDISATNGNGLITYHPSAWDGVDNTQWGIGTTDAQGVIRSSNTSLIHHRGGIGSSTIWDSGNDGTGSGLDADLLDGKQPADLNVGSANVLKGIDSGDTTTASGTGNISYIYDIPSNTEGLFYSVSNDNSILTLNRHYGDFYSQLGFDGYNKIYYRCFHGVVIDTTTPWKQLAFTDSNVASADKLTTKQLTNEDLNTIKSNGNTYTVYYADSENTCVNKPSTIDTGFMLFVYGTHNANFTNQTIVDTIRGTVYYRTLVYGNVWYSWKKMLTENDIASLVSRIEALEARPTIASVDSLPSTPNNNTLYAIPE